MKETETLPEQSKKRYEWIDNARIIAAFLIMFHHMLLMTKFGGVWGSLYVNHLVMDVPYFGRVPLFLILAGYFLSRNITWGKAFDRFIWLLIPFVIWNAIYGYLILGNSFTWRGVVPHLTGINYFFVGPSLSLFGPDVPCAPDIGPSWFLRDIMLLSLLTPIIVKFQKWLPVILLLISSLLIFNHPTTPKICLTPPNVFFYLIGVCLAKYKISDAYRILNPSFTPVVVVAVIVSFLLVTVGRIVHIDHIDNDMYWSGFASCTGMVFGAMIIAHCGVLIETHFPKISRKLAPCGPACFLVFMLHMPIFTCLQKVIPANIWHSWFILLLPLPTFCLIVAFFLGMKKYTPWLMPYLGHMKVQKPKPAPAPESKPAA